MAMWMSPLVNSKVWSSWRHLVQTRPALASPALGPTGSVPLVADARWSSFNSLAVTPAAWSTPSGGLTWTTAKFGLAQAGVGALVVERLVGAVEGGMGFLQTLFTKSCVGVKGRLGSAFRLQPGAWVAVSSSSWRVAQVLGQLGVTSVGSAQQWLERGFFFPDLQLTSRPSAHGRKGIHKRNVSRAFYNNVGYVGRGIAETRTLAWGTPDAVRQLPLTGGSLARPVDGQAGSELPTVGGTSVLAPLFRTWANLTRRWPSSIGTLPIELTQAARRLDWEQGRGRLAARQSTFPALGVRRGSMVHPVSSVNRGFRQRLSQHAALLAVPSATQRTSIDGDYSPAGFTFKQPQVRYRPGFMTHWRHHRRVFKVKFQLSQGHGQRRLTRFLTRLRRLVSFSYLRLAQLSLDTLVAVSWLVETSGRCPVWFVRSWVSSGWVFVNGTRCLNPRRQLHVGDLLALREQRLEREVSALHTARGSDAYLSSTEGTHTDGSDAPGCLEVDELTLTAALLIEPRDWFKSPDRLALILPFTTIKLYNWKYTT